uniref:Uncharacterized protein n=1 Tax=Siphoviridae sp. ctKRD15 TaxID=2825441 RepID=A0A8S5V5F1_9CAUD|nr:MAG TPA: hypothetical protein [Siphoviridae sp. ctKRD15]
MWIKYKGCIGRREKGLVIIFTRTFSLLLLLYRYNSLRLSRFREIYKEYIKLARKLRK